MRDWLDAWQVTDVAMESTGVFWKPVYYLLEERFTCCLVNAAHLAHVPGRKTDVADAHWIAQCLECGLLRASFVPPPPIRDRRDLTRYRKAHQSGPKRRPTRTRHGNRWLRQTLPQAALAVTRKTDCALAAPYYRIRRHRGHKNTVIAVAHALVVTAYHVLARDCDYRELGADYLDRRSAERTQQRAVRALERLGYRVTLEPAA